jgi:hypothetical protein
MNNDEKKALDKLINNNKDYVDNTEGIRRQKHSGRIREEILIYKQLKLNYSRVSNKMLEKIAEKQLVLLHTEYNYIFTRLLQNKIELKMFDKFITVLEEIEDGKLDQNEASYKIGSVLKEIYIDKELQSNKTEKKKPVNNVSYKQFMMIE